MVIQSEQLLEVLLDLERSRQRERDTRLEAEALLEGLRSISTAHEWPELFQSLLLALGNVIDFEEAFILKANDSEKMTVLATTCASLRESSWEIGPVFTKVLAGKPVAVFDISQVPEWKHPPETIAGIRSALHIGLKGKDWETILVVTHSQPKHFGPSHVKKALRFSPLAAQALLTLELRRAVLERDRFYQLALDAMAIFTVEGLIIQHNQGWAESLGPADKGQKPTLFDLVHPKDIELLQDTINTLRMKEGKRLIKVRFKEKSGLFHWYSCSIAVYPDQMMYYIVARDITESVLFEQQLAYQAGHDALTGLKNRAEFMEYLKAAFSDYQGNNRRRFALFFLDLNGFKTVNDTLGHDMGDELLKSFARTLQDSVRSEDVVSRLGGDEFAIIVNRIQSKSDVEAIAYRINHRGLVPYQVKGHQVLTTASIGIAISSAEYESGEEMLRAADLAMYTAKQDKSVQFHIHADSLGNDCSPGH